MNSRDDLIYIDKNYNINKLCSDMKTRTTSLKRDDVAWNLLSIYCSPYTANFLVGMHRPENNRDKVNRLNSSGLLIQITLYMYAHILHKYASENVK